MCSEKTSDIEHEKNLFNKVLKGILPIMQNKSLSILEATASLPERDQWIKQHTMEHPSDYDAECNETIGDKIFPAFHLVYKLHWNFPTQNLESQVYVCEKQLLWTWVPALKLVEEASPVTWLYVCILSWWFSEGLWMSYQVNETWFFFQLHGIFCSFSCVMQLLTFEFFG